MHSVRDWMTKKVYTIKEDSYASDAIRAFLRYKISIMPVLKNEKLVGIVSEKDLLKAALKDISKVRVKDVMSKKVHTVAPDINVMNATLQMDKNNIKQVPVVENNKLIGIITAKDFVKQVSNV